MHEIMKDKFILVISLKSVYILHDKKMKKTSVSRFMPHIQPNINISLIQQSTGLTWDLPVWCSLSHIEEQPFPC